MKKRIISLLFIVALVFVVTGCNKEKENENGNIEEPTNKNVVTLECTHEDPYYGGDYGTKLTGVTMKIAEFTEGYLTKEESRTIETINDASLFQERKESSGGEKTEKNGNLTTIVKIDENKRTITTSYISVVDYNDLDNTTKESYKASNFIKEIEQMDFNCTIKGATRQELGL